MDEDMTPKLEVRGGLIDGALVAVFPNGDKLELIKWSGATMVNQTTLVDVRFEHEEVEG